MDPEKNFVDVSKLFEWSKQYSIKTNKNKTMKVYIRLVGDADVNKARVFALRKSAELRGKLRDKNSDERLAFISEPDNLNREKIIEIVSMLNVRNFTQEAIRNVKLSVPKEPDSDSDTEEKEKYQKEIDDYPKKREILVRKSIEDAIEKKKKSLTKLEDVALGLEYENAMISELCEEEVLKRFREFCVYCSVYTDSRFTKRLFKSFNDFDNLPQEKKTEFTDFYTLLELETSELKK